MGGGITKLNSNAFTLIELLAIIVILAIIAVITVPIILNIIENSRKGAATDSAYGYKDAVNKYYVTELSKPENQNLILNGQYDVSDGGVLNGIGITNKEIPVSGDKPSSGYLNYSNNTLTSGCLVFGDYAVTFDGNTTSTVKGTCSSSTEISNGEQSGSGSESGSQTPSNPYLTTFDGNYTYRYYNEDYDAQALYDGEYIEWRESLDGLHGLHIYQRKNTDTDLFEQCIILPSSTVCIAPSLWDYNCEEEAEYDEELEDYVYNTTCSSGVYVLSKKAEFESDNLSCSVEAYDENLGDGFLDCSGTYEYDAWGDTSWGTVHIKIEPSGEIKAEDVDSHWCDKSGCSFQ